MNRRIFYWGLYDFANSIVLVAFLFYFSQWLVEEQGRPAWWYNVALVAASLLFILSTPMLSRTIDATGKKLRGLRIWTGIALLSLGSVAVIAALSNTLDVLATMLYAFSMYAYLMAFLYFTPMLSDLSTPENRARVSGIGQGMNSFGQAVGLILTLPFAIGTITLFGDPGRAQALLISVPLFGLFALPLLALYRETEHAVILRTARDSVNPLSLVRIILAHRPLAFLFLAYFFFSDALLTFTNNFPLFLEKVFHSPDTIKAFLTIGILLLASIGAPVFGCIADRIGHRKTLVMILLGYMVLFPALAITSYFPLAILICLIAGFLFGPVWGISRAMVAQLAPPEFIASSFSYYIIAERFATFVGPLVWVAVLMRFGEGELGYRLGLIAMGVLGAFGLAILGRVKEASPA
ncbi:MFS transporter [Candidatus Kaiserbacteria bacterium]|nr:MFS transporter [Candidatus Kaiserbacteria bacterium]